MPKILKHQHWHLLLLIVLLGLTILCEEFDPGILAGKFWGISTKTWLTIAILVPIAHQVYVLLCWRSELFYKGLSKLFGGTGTAFLIYKVGFSILFASRLISIIFLALSNSASFTAHAGLRYSILILIAFPAVYLFYSVKKYFGMDRAYGLDHFKPEEMKNKPFVKKGIFKYSSNGMYTFGFFVLWMPGLITLSKAALLAALFNHLYIWVHYYFTELPDIKTIYRK